MCFSIEACTCVIFTFVFQIRQISIWNACGTIPHEIAWNRWVVKFWWNRVDKRKSRFVWKAQWWVVRGLFSRWNIVCPKGKVILIRGGLDSFNTATIPLRWSWSSCLKSSALFTEPQLHLLLLWYVWWILTYNFRVWWSTSDGQKGNTADSLYRRV